ncbi:MAG: glutaredoxin domain-containing protein [Actinomycetota bacterium]
MTVLLIVVAAVALVLVLRAAQGTTPIPVKPLATEPIEAIELFLRPGCPWCERLTAGVHRAGIPANRRNIWDDPADAAIVRSIANGNETVPTVVVGAVGLVNPSLSTLKKTIAEHAPHLL